VPALVLAIALSICFATSYVGIVSSMAVAAEGSFVKAGERLEIGRSSVCRNVQKLEMYLSTHLFLRTTRSTSLTQEGRGFFENCNEGAVSYRRRHERHAGSVPWPRLAALSESLDSGVRTEGKFL
jgi:DNA-binding transcriptional LysR family regulator